MTISKHDLPPNRTRKFLNMQYFSDKIFVSNILAGSVWTTSPQPNDSKDFTNSIRNFFNLDHFQKLPFRALDANQHVL